ncbi:hypothetical protein JD969_09765 [Planctomycetota bacterium]|nr:hypothetical protein JD969_09765 [Planctomycetota bacterium]
MRLMSINKLGLISGCILFMLVGCTNYQKMDVTVERQQTRLPIDNVQVASSYAEPGWYWPFAPETNKAVTDKKGEAQLDVAWYERGTFIEIAGVKFELNKEAFKQGAIFQNLNFRARISPALPTVEQLQQGDQ